MSAPRLVRRITVRLALAVAAAVLASGVAAAPPNIIILLADDLGYADLGCQGGKPEVSTPHIDSLAANGVRFTDAYVTSAMCAPSRAGLMSGRYQQRYGFEFDINAPPARNNSESFGLPRNEPTLAERLRTAGYATSLAGKWHLGFAEGLRPTERGFDSFFGFHSGWHTYVPGGVNVDKIWRGTEPVEEDKYLTFAFAREACAFVARQGQGQRPFFLYLAFNAVHFPLAAPPDLEKRFASVADPTRRTYAAVLAAMDDAVGEVLALLRARGLEENTLVFFLNDNGGPTAQTRASNAPLRGFKMQLYEGGIRVPFLMKWKGRIPAGMVYREPVTALDIHATALAAAGVPAPRDKPLDGVDLLPYLTGERRDPPHDRLFWREGGQSAVRMGDWKLVQARTGAAQLFNVREDIGEEHDLAAQEPKKFDELADAWEEWNRRVQPKIGK